MLDRIYKITKDGSIEYTIRKILGRENLKTKEKIS